MLSLNVVSVAHYVLIFTENCCKDSRCCCLSRLNPLKQVDKADLFSATESYMNHVTASREIKVCRNSLSTTLASGIQILFVLLLII